MSVAEQSIVGAEDRSPGFLSSSVGRKVVMAVTGVVLWGFVTVHMLGNLTSYMGAEAMNHYAEFLHTVIHGMGIWVFRAVLLTAVLLHIWAALSLTLSNQAARPVGYRAQQRQAATWASLSMRWTGVILAIFIVYHLLHLTVGTVHPDFRPGDAYHNFVAAFKVPAASAFYIVAQLCLGLHMWHGVWSFTQSLGWSHPRYNALRRNFATVLTILVVGVNISYPVAVLTGFIH